ncbi:uncharacterized protein LOC122950539 [Acropora millepora]|uniref:uncharacterized protein LOC122950539 n=1 Tax=Acropora millepora TaxID=45264 RepID=UPI001CF195E3|nr:uncharacterized protein LOC122950539 [Acropora millepora]
MVEIKSKIGSFFLHHQQAEMLPYWVKFQIPTQNQIKLTPCCKRLKKGLNYELWDNGNKESNMQSGEEKGRSKKKSLQESKHRSMEKGIKKNRSEKPTKTLK